MEYKQHLSNLINSSAAARIDLATRNKLLREENKKLRKENFELNMLLLALGLASLSLVVIVGFDVLL